MNTLINQLIQYGLDQELIEKYDIDYVANRLIDLLGQDEFVYVRQENVLPLPQILNGMLDILADQKKSTTR